jgi:hypothetical protein
MFQGWAMDIGQGGSLYKVAKELFTKKECHYFLNFTDGNADSNVWRSRCIRNNISKTFTDRIVKTLYRRNVPIRSKQWIEFVEFVGRNQEDFANSALLEIMDFLHAQFTEIRTLKDRTVSSLTRMSNEWHQAFGRTKNNGKYTSWDGSGIGPWHIQFKNDPTFWFLVEILNSKDLYTEGNKLRHCVSAYTRRCEQGQVNVFSLRKKDFKDSPLFTRCVTIEVQSGTIYQARRKMNKKPTSEELSIIRRWARDSGIGAPENAFQRYW